MRELINRQMFDKRYILAAVEETDREGYIYEMYINNSIEGFIPPKERAENGREYLLYNITYLKTLEEEYRTRTIELEDLLKLMQCICRQREKLSKYMLPNSGMVLCEKYIYSDMTNGENKLLYLPFVEKAAPDSLLDYLIGKIDHEDDQMTEAVYEAYASRDIPGWEEVLKGKLLLIRSERKLEKEENENTFNIEENRESTDPIPQKSGRSDKKKRKNGICFLIIYMVFAIVFMYELFSNYLLNVYEVGILVLMSVLLTMTILCIIIHYIEPSYIDRIFVKLNFIKGKTKRTDREDKGIDRRWFTGEEESGKDMKTQCKTRVRVFEVDGQVAIETLAEDCPDTKESALLIPGQTILFHPENDFLIDN